MLISRSEKLIVLRAIIGVVAEIEKIDKITNVISRTDLLTNALAFASNE